MKNLKKVLSLLLSLVFIFSLSACSDSNKDSNILSNPVISTDYSTNVKLYADNLYKTAESLTGFSIVGSESDKARADYIYDLFTEIGLSNVEKVPVMLNTWEYSAFSISANCNCADESLLKMRLVGAYPSNFDFNNTTLIMHYVGDKNQITEDFINGYAIMLPKYNNLEDLESAVQIVSEYNPALIITCSTLTNTTNLYNINTNYMQNINVPIINIPVNSYSLLKSSYDKSVKNATKMELYLDGFSKISEELVESYFIQGEIKGKSDKIVYVTSHFDSIHNNYMSSCVSTGELIAMAEKLIKEGYKPDYTIRFLATTGQEWGLVGEGQNVGIETYLSNLLDKEKEDIQIVFVLDGSYPIVDGIYTQTCVSSDLIDTVTEYNDNFFKENSIKFINEVSEINIDLNYTTEAEVWSGAGFSTILTSEMKNSRFIYNDTSADTNSLIINEDFLSYYMNYYIELVKIMSKK